MFLGIDFGASTTDAVLLNGKKLARAATSASPLNSANALNSFLRKQGFGEFKIEKAAVTGGKSSFFKGKVLGMKPKHVPEITAIGLGASFLANAKKCLAVSFGTGTCIVLFEKGKSRHVIGSGLGGGTITGLSRLLLKESNSRRLSGLALRGNLGKTDLSVKEIMGKGFGMVHENATGSNFAKGKGGSADLAAAVQSMVAESIAVLAVSSARQCNCNRIVFTGKTVAFPLVKRRLISAGKCFGSSFEFPKNAGIATAFGAALSIQEI